MALWTPANYGSTISQWLTAADDATKTLDGSNNVSAWDDKSSSNNDATQSTESLRPNATTVDSRKTLQFAAGAGDAKQLTHSSIISSGGDYTSFYVIKQTATTTNSVHYLHAGAIGSGAIGLAAAMNVFSDGMGIFKNSGARQEEATAPTGWQILCFRPASLRRNGAAVAGYSSGNANTVTGGQLTMIGARPDFSGLHFVGCLSEAVVLPSSLSDSDVELFEGYLHWEWGLQANLPGGHTYSAAAPTTGGSLILPQRRVYLPHLVR